MIFLYILEHTMLPILSLIVIGFILDRKFKLDVKTLSKILFYLIMPSFVFKNVYLTTFPSSTGSILCCALALFFINAIIATLVGKFRRYDQSMIEAFRNGTMFNNSANLGVALIILVFTHNPFLVNGEPVYLAEAMIAQIILMVFQNITLNTIGLFQAGRGQLAAMDAVRIVLRMPIIYVLIVVFAIKYFQIDATQFFFWPIMERAGEALLPLAMCSIGIQLSRTKIIWLDPNVWLTTIIKLIVTPLIAIGLIYVLGTFTPVTAQVFLIYSAVPTAVNTALFAIELDNCPEFATQVVMNTTVLSSITLTFFIFLANILFPAG